MRAGRVRLRGSQASQLSRALGLSAVFTGESKKKTYKRGIPVRNVSGEKVVRCGVVLAYSRASDAGLLLVLL